MAPAATRRSTVELDIEDTVKVWPQRRDTWMYVSVADEHTARIDAIFEADPRGFGRCR